MPGFGQFGLLPTVRSGSKLNYFDSIYSRFKDDVLFGYKMDETSGAVMNDVTGLFNGTYNNVTLNQPGFSGVKSIASAATSYINIYKSGLHNAANWDEGAIILWFKIDTAKWTNGSKYWFINLYADANNAISITKSSDNAIYASYKAGGVSASSYIYHLTNNSWCSIVLTWSKVAAKAKAYFNGELFQTTDLASGTWSATSLNSGATSLVSSFGGSAVESLIGNVASVFMLKKTLSYSEVKAICNFKTITFDGDSRTRGGVLIHMPSAAIGNLQSGIINKSISGASVATLASDADTRVDTVKTSKNNILVFWAGVNSSSLTASQIYDQIAAYCTARKAAGWRVVLCTEIDAQDATRLANSWATKYIDLNTMIRNSHAFADEIVDLGADLRFQNATNTTYFNADKVHLTSAGYYAVGALINAKLVSLF